PFRVSGRGLPQMALARPYKTAVELQNRGRALQTRWWEPQLAAGDEHLRRRDRGQGRLDVHATVTGRVGPQPAGSFLELPLAPWTSAAPRLVPGDGDVDEPLQEVPFLGRRRPPLVLEL